MNEMLRYQGRLAQTELAVDGLKVRLRGLRDSLRALLDLFEPVEKLDSKLIMSVSADLGLVQAELKEKLQEIAAIKKALGR